jgi:hypothetical protein
MITMNGVTGPQLIADKLRPILTEPEEAGYLILASEYKNFLSNVNDHPCFDEFKNSPKFLSLLTQVCLAKKLTYEERVYCNAMIFKQINTKDEFVKVMLINLGLAANRNMTESFVKCGLDRTMAVFLAVSRKSSFNSRDCISRMNFAIMCTSPALMTAQRISDIYCACCNNEEDVYNLFATTNKDTISRGTEWYTQDHAIIESHMDSALVSILDTLPTKTLANILEAYYLYEISRYELDEDDVRIKFHALNPQQWPNISKALAMVEKKGYYVP